VDGVKYPQKKKGFTEPGLKQNLNKRVKEGVKKPVKRGEKKVGETMRNQGETGKP